MWGLPRRTLLGLIPWGREEDSLARPGGTGRVGAANQRDWLAWGLSGRQNAMPRRALGLQTHHPQPSLKGVSGYYFADCNPAEPMAHMQDAEMAARLWQVSEELVQGYLP